MAGTASRTSYAERRHFPLQFCSRPTGRLSIFVRPLCGKEPPVLTTGGPVIGSVAEDWTIHQGRTRQQDYSSANSYPFMLFIVRVGRMIAIRNIRTVLPNGNAGTRLSTNR